MAAARTSFSNDSRIVKVPLPKSVLLKDYLIDDLNSCSSNGFRSYPRQPCCTKVRYLIQIDLNKHINLPPTHKKFLRSKSKLKSKSKSSSVLQKASAAVVNVFKHFQFSGSGKRAKANFLPKNLSRKLSKHGFWKRTIDRPNEEFNKRLNSFDEPVKEKKKNVLSPPSKLSTAVTTTAAEVNTSTSNSNSSASSDSYFTITTSSICSIINSSSKINVAQNDVEECEQHTTEKKNTANGMKSGVATATADSDVIIGNAKKEEESEKKEQFSPVSVMDFPCDDDDQDEVTSPFQDTHLYAEGTKRKLMSKVKRVKSLAKLTPVRLEDRITLSESTTTTHDLLLHEESSNQTGKKATALLQQLKATMSSCNQFESIMTQNVLLGFFIERIMEGSVSNFALLQEAKDWINGDGHAREITFESLVRDMDKEKAKWAKYDDEVEKREVCLVLECQVFTSLVEEMLLEIYM